VIDGSKSTGPWQLDILPIGVRRWLAASRGRGRHRQKAERLTLTSEKVRQALQPAGSYRK
jgi:hypothetical protein